MFRLMYCLFLPVFVLSFRTHAATINVGPSRTVKTLSDAVPIAKPADTIIISPPHPRHGEEGSIRDQQADSVCWHSTNMLILHRVDSGFQMER